MGYLNPSPDDDAHIQAMADGGTTELPGASGLDGLLSSIPKGFVSGVDKVQQLSEAVGASDTGSALYSAFTHVPQSTIQQLAVSAQDTEKNDANVKAIQSWAATGQDPRVTGGIGRMAAGTSEGLTIAGLGTAAGGPWGAAVLLGGSEGYGDYLQNKANGLDEDTAQEKAGITGLAAAASAFIPVKFGKTALQAVVGGIGSNLMVGVASRAATAGVLNANGYTAMAQQAKVFDSQAMLADTIMGAAFGAMGHYTHGAPERVNPADVDAAAATLVENHLNRSAPGIPTDPEVANLHVDTMQHAIDALTNGRDVDTPSEPDARTLLGGSLPDPAHSWEYVAPPAPGFVRMFHGAHEGADPNTGGSRWFATTPEYAQGYGSGERNVWYVDVPADHPDLVRLVDDSDVAFGIPQRHGNSELPESIAEQAKPYRPKNAILEAAHSELPGFTDAIEPIKEVAPEPRTEGPALEPLLPKAEGEPAPRPLDDMVHAQLDPLVRQYGDMQVTREDGTVGKLSDVAREMQQEAADADRMAKAHEAAAACFIRTGGAL